MTTNYQIQTQNAAGQWTTEHVAGHDDDATFDSRAEAEAAIAELRKLGEEWASAEYRIAEIDSPTATVERVGLRSDITGEYTREQLRAGFDRDESLRELRAEALDVLDADTDSVAVEICAGVIVATVVSE